MRALLLSHYFTDEHHKRLQQMLGKSKASRALFVTTPAVPYTKDGNHPAWITESLDYFVPLVDSYDTIDLEGVKYFDTDLNQYDLIWVTGGNVFYTACRFEESGFGEAIKSYLKEDAGVYVGSSAGSVILMSDLTNFSGVDDHTQAPRICSGLGVLDYAVIPHADSVKHGKEMHKVAKLFRDKNIQFQLIGDNEAWSIWGKDKELIK